MYRTVTLVDTPGHVDFSPEAERVLPILDCAILVISGTDGIQSHTLDPKLAQHHMIASFPPVHKDT